MKKSGGNVQIHRFGLDSFHLFSALLLHHSKETEGSEAITQIERYGTITFVLRELIENRKKSKTRPQLQVFKLSNR